MDAQVVYDASGNVVSVTFPDPESGAHVEVVPGEGESVLAVDVFTVTQPSMGEHGESAAPLTVITGHRVDVVKSELVPIDR